MEFECACGFNGSHGHTSKCKVYAAEVARVAEAMIPYIADVYRTNYSVSECCLYVKAKENSIILESSLRRPITQYLDSLGIREKLGGKILNAKRQEKAKATMLERYGVTNAGQLEDHGFKASNKIPYKNLELQTDYNAYRKEAETATFREVCKIKKEGLLPAKCFYTGITFNDEILDKVNPNDPKKRSVDHKVSVVEAFMRGWSIEKVCDRSNLVFCLRVVNSIKGHTNEKDFRRLLLPLLLQRLKDED